MNQDQIKIGQRVKTLRAFCGVPLGTEGVLDEDYGTGVMIAWDMADSNLPAGYSAYDGVPAVRSGILRDGFDKDDELQFLEVVENG